MSLHLRPQHHADEYHHGRAPAGRSVEGPRISVDRADDLYGIVLYLDPLPAETFDDREVERTLTPDEARELAAILWHHADELDRRLR